MRFGAFLRGALGVAKPDAAALARVKAWALAVLDAAPDTALTVNEIVCTDPGCPGVETVLLVMEPGRKTRACKIPKALEDVTDEDVRAALA